MNNQSATFETRMHPTRIILLGWRDGLAGFDFDPVYEKLGMGLAMLYEGARSVGGAFKAGFLPEKPEGIRTFLQVGKERPLDQHVSLANSLLEEAEIDPGKDTPLPHTLLHMLAFAALSDITPNRERRGLLNTLETIALKLPPGGEITSEQIVEAYVRKMFDREKLTYKHAIYARDEIDPRNLGQYPMRVDDYGTPMTILRRGAEEPVAWR